MPGVEILEAVTNFKDDLRTVVDPAWPERNGSAVTPGLGTHQRSSAVMV